MKLIEKNDLYPIYRNKENQVMMTKYFEEAHSNGVLSNERYNEAKAVMDVIFRLRQNTGAIDSNFREVFSQNGDYKGINDASNLGADIGGLDSRGKVILCMNVEFGVNFTLINPKLENAEEYLTLIENVTSGLKEPANFKILFNYNNLSQKIEEKGLENKPRETTKKI